MDVCRACESQLMDGITKCPTCGANLVRPGTFIQISGWVLAVVSLIPLSVGVIAAVQGVYAPMMVGLGFLVVGTVCVITGKLRMASSPAPTLPSVLPTTWVTPSGHSGAAVG